MSHKKNFVKKGQIYRSLVATALVANGIFQLVAPVLAEGGAGGQTIDNTATATYEDPNNPGETINTTSNTVRVTIAEVAGITVTPANTEFTDSGDQNGDSKINIGDKVYYNYTVTNVGNDPTKFRIPDQPTVTGPATLTTVNAPDNPGDPDGPVEISYDGGTTWETVATGGTTTNSIDPDESVLVRVAVEVQPGAQSGETIAVKLGETPGDEQNIPRSSDGGDVFTVDNDDNGAPGEVAGTPSNGVREASATLEAVVDSDLKTYTLAKVLKVRSDHTVAGADGPSEDTVTYDLSLEVENTDPTGNGISPSPLEGTPIDIGGTTSDQILVSDAIPQGTSLSSVVVPPGWQAVTTTNGLATRAYEATWQILADPNTIPANVTRIGFVRTGSIAPGQTVGGFKVTVQLNTTTDTSVTVANVAQLFGKSPNNIPVYDESGDNNPSNYNDDGTPLTDTDTTGGPNGTPDRIPDAPDGGGFFPNTVVEDGSVDPNNPGDIDTQNNNSGTGEKGEPNVFTISEQGDFSLLNGPKDNPDAVAENDNNKDFTNQSSLVPAGTVPGTGVDPDGVSFTNTVQNTGQAAADIVVEPIPPATATDLPNGTTVTVTYQSQLATYTYDPTANANAGGFTLSSGTQVKIPQVAANATDNYGVEVNLPPDTKLSTDTDVERGYPVPMKSFIVDATDQPLAEDGTVFTDSNTQTQAQNVTIDRVYVGYLQMVKETRVLKDDGPDVLNNDGTFSTDPKTPAPGNVLEYRITYENISEPQSGTGNIILNASDIRITEDGTDTTLGNNWAVDNDNNGEIDTSNVVGSASDSGGANVEFTPNGDQSGTTQAADVTTYVVVVSDDVEPKEARTFTFQRKINATGQTGDNPTGGTGGTGGTGNPTN
ncbi:hypothetical protein Riv7116_3597 [Rivularia sp. PCC 7116]|uniref:DUF7925 domain-containing protein n=1 Tax=Rivularia sp. PCC 7116 TaxID=373994 RepID=UPI00029EF277|nr:hypothetical protein [Rivularia sp. PCC 7116]AFY56048.1 hypothetical protein Riv7116_3597 [Rivularia sp. PCC 7116]